MQIRLISPLEKCFLDEKISDKKEYKEGSCLKNELFHFCVCYTGEKEKEYACLSVESEIRDYVRVARIEVVPVQFPSQSMDDDYFLRKTPGLYPDVMQPLEPNGRLAVSRNLKALMVEVDPRGEIKAGKYPITFCFQTETEQFCQTFTLEIINALLPEQELIYTQWFYCDCLKDFYHTDTFDDRHFALIERFASTAVRYGVNMLLTPIFTPALDTYVGGERPTMQLVEIRRDKGKYSFDFTLLKRWVEMCNRIGVKYFEIPHFFTQWGAKATPKIMATVDGEYKRIFGWETLSCSVEYVEFLGVFIPAFLEFMKSLDHADQKCYFHISDEPWEEHLESYLAAKQVVAPLLEGYPIIDALSSYQFYSQGIVKRPVVSLDHIDPFIENKAEELWGYYCCGQGEEVSNRFIAMPSHRNRIIGTQLYKYRLAGFLHWGYNFYYNQFSFAFVDPFMNTDGEYFSAAGDCFSVYPGHDGRPWESIRLLVFADALQDMRAFRLCEQLYSREFVLNILEDGSEPITFRKYPRDEEYLLRVREKINRAIQSALK